MVPLIVLYNLLSYIHYCLIILDGSIVELNVSKVRFKLNYINVFEFSIKYTNTMELLNDTIIKYYNTIHIFLEIESEPYLKKYL